MIFGSVCSGIEAASVAWHPLGWTPAWFAEIEKFPSSVLAHRWPGVINLGDFTRIAGNPFYNERGSIDLLVGGTPCQAFSVAGLRGGLADPRGSLALAFAQLADRLRPRWIVWENVPGVLSSGGGRDFGAILGALVQLGYGVAYRILDAQFFGVPQRRRRIFLVGHLGDWRRAAAVLFDAQSMRGNPNARRKKGKDASAGAPRSPGSCGPIPFDVTQITSSENRSFPLPGDPSMPLARTARPPAIAFHPTQDPISGQNSPTLGRTTGWMGVCVTGDVAHTLRGEGFDASEDGTGRGTPITIANCLRSNSSRNHIESTYVPQGYQVRRLTPRECERLQGFPDDYTLVPGASDSARYRALGNSMAVPCMRWIGERIARVDGI